MVPKAVTSREAGHGSPLDSRNISPLRSRTFRLLWTGQSLSALGDQIFLIALILHVYELGGSALQVSTLLLFGTFVPAFLAPFGAVVAERVGRRRLLVTADVMRGLIVVLMVVTHSFPVTVLLYFGLGLASAFFRPIYQATVPVVVGPSQLRAANALSNLTWTGSVMLGPAIGGALTGALGFAPAFLFNAASFLISALCLLAAPELDATAPPAGERRSSLESLRHAAHFVLSRRAVLGTALTAVLLVLFAPMVNSAMVVLVKTTLRATDWHFGLMSSAWGVGMVAGSWVLLATSRLRLSDEASYLFTFVIQGATYVLIGRSATVGWAVAWSAIGGVGNGMDVALTDTLLQKHVPQEQQLWVFSVLNPLQRVAVGLSTWLGGLFTTLLSARFTYVLAGLGLLLAAILGVPLLFGTAQRESKAT